MRTTCAIFCLWLASSLTAGAKPNVQHPADFPSVTLVPKSSAEMDKGTVLGEIVVVNKRFRADQMPEATAEALRLNGWAAASAKERERLALLWCKEVLLWQTPALESEPEAFKAAQHPFHTPQAKSTPRGVAVSYWVKQADSLAGPGRHFVHFVVTFDSQGKPDAGQVETWSP